MTRATRPILLTGATGFVGRHLYPALRAAGFPVRCASRRPEQAAERYPSRQWAHFDIADRDSVRRALDGCDTAYYLVHGIGSGVDYPERERRAAALFANEARRAGLRRIIYLGGVAPRDPRPSRHLSSRQRTGEILRAGEVPVCELRAAMIIGVGSASWTMVRDLSARLPAMILPSWLNNRSSPVAIDDVVFALVKAAELPATCSASFSLPGPETVTHRDLLVRTSAALRRRRLMVGVPALSPRLSSYWIALVTRVSLDMARELVEGVRHDLQATAPPFWRLIGHHPIGVNAAIHQALQDSRDASVPSEAAEARLRDIGRDDLSTRPAPSPFPSIPPLRQPSRSYR